MVNDGVSIQYTTLERDEVLLKRKVYDDKPTFFMLGSKKHSEHTRSSTMDLLEEMNTLSRPAIYAVNYLKGKIRFGLDSHNERYDGDITDGYATTVTHKGLSKSNSNSLSKGLKELIERNIVAKIGYKRYMINPDAIIPRCTIAANKLWDTLTNS